MNVEYKPLSELKPNSRNARRHPRKQLRKLATSLKRYGCRTPLLIEGDGTIIAGHGRLEAGKLAGLTTLPVVFNAFASDSEKRAYMLADNRLPEEAVWDKDVLASELHCLANDNFDLGLTAFDIPEIDQVFEVATEADGPDSTDLVPDLRETPVSRVGDLWQLGKHHRLMCGDAHDEATYDAVLDGELVEAVFTDPPYNVPIQGHVGGRGRVRHDEFLVASGELDSETFAGFLRDAFAQAAAHSVDGSLHYICMDWRHIGEMLSAGRAVYQELNNLCVWNKSNAGMGSFYRSKHELVFVWKRGTAPHINNVQLGSYGRSRTNVWDYPGANAFGADRMRELAMHPTVKPTALIADALKDCTRRNGLVLDSFAGSGSTIIAAEMTGRRARAIELDPRYVDVAVRRWQAWSGKAAVLCADGRSFESVEEERAAKAAAA